MRIGDGKAASTGKRGSVKFRHPTSPDSLEYAHMNPIFRILLLPNKCPNFNIRDSMGQAI